MIDASRSPLTYLITKGEATPDRFSVSSRDILQIVKGAVDSGIDLIQVREKLITTKQLFELAVQAAQTVSGSQTKLLINGRADVALAAGADGVHLPEDGVPIEAVRRMSPSRFVIGSSVHSLEPAQAAKSDGADFVLFGPVFESPGKTGVGLESLANICRSLEGFPVLAVGGINANNYASVLECGASGYAAIRYLNDVAMQKASL